MASTPPWPITALLRQTLQGRSRSTVLTSLGWLLGILLTAILGAVYLKAPGLLVAALSAQEFITVGLYLYAYVFFMRTDPEALRSERYALGKLAIDKGVIGDDLAGIIEVEPSGTSIVPAGKKGSDRQ